MNAEFGAIGTVSITFRDRFQDSLIYNDVIGYQIGGNAVSVTRQSNESEIIPLDLVSRVSFKLNEQQGE